jgi:23S rRNA (cytidine1920-2'-O)/16S rRNA (cytidine1409-2'-O)-methyltransferase
MKLESGEVPRLDVWLVEHGYFTSRQTAKRAIKAGLVRVDNMLHKPSTHIKGTESIEILDGQADRPMGFQKLSRINQLLTDPLVIENDLALDIGCSAGGFLAYLAHNGARVTGIEISPHFLSELESLVNEYDNISVLIADAFDLDLSVISGRKRLDLLLIDVTTDIDGTLHLVKKFTPLLKPKGRLLAALKSKYSQDILSQVDSELEHIGYVDIQDILLDKNRTEFHIVACRM